VVLVNLWATWCGPCRMEMPELIKLQDEYRDKGLVIIGLDTDDEPVEMVKTFAERQQLNYPVGWTSNEVRDGLLNISRAPAIPQSFILTTDGKLAGVFKGYNPSRTPADVRKTIDEILSRTSE
jgi:thiol-disulfide isomerase/thioredoxin